MADPMYVEVILVRHVAVEVHDIIMSWLYHTDISSPVTEFTNSSGSLKQDDFKLYLHQKSSRCTSNSPIQCITDPPLYDDPSAGNPPGNSSIAANSTTPQFNGSTETGTNSSQVSTSEGSPANDVNSLPLNNTISPPTVGDSNTGGLAISTAGIAFIVVGGSFFIVLVILFLILVACLCPRNSVKKTFVPTAAPASGSKCVYIILS